MSKGKFNRIQVMFNAEHQPYMYGAIHIVDGDIDNQWWERPFVISKRRAGGSETVFGTVARTMEKVWSQLERLEAFRSETERRLRVAGIKPIDGTASQLHPSELADQIVDEQENLVEDVLLSISVNVRVLSEIFPGKMKGAKANVYDYDGNCVGNIELSRIADLLLHNRYILIRGDYVVDLISDERFMSDKPQLGLKVSFPEYLGEVQHALDELTVSDLIGKLYGATKRLSSSSNIKDIVFLTQNLYTLGGLVVTDGARIEGGPLNSILDKVASRVRERNGKPGPEEVTPIALGFGTPTFSLEPDLDDKQVRVCVKVNGKPEELVMGYEEFFAEVSKAHGDGKLRSSFRRKTPLQS